MEERECACAAVMPAPGVGNDSTVQYQLNAHYISIYRCTNNGVQFLKFKIEFPHSLQATKSRVVIITVLQKHQWTTPSDPELPVNHSARTNSNQTCANGHLRTV
ncbi:hypothetical protein HW555_007197 [Spodoptera exigua]|uniref:Uncharacterized protein n=1 Tax=Spodoptera exigua TaxID=7107 RepID=A0A835GDH5_SPOEX|nr:hypothetical protein HW555_007197 [Spodoptera exigua]